MGPPPAPIARDRPTNGGTARSHHQRSADQGGLRPLPSPGIDRWSGQNRCPISIRKKWEIR
eukprot:2925529-Pyramimonas_sp.AAC.1